MNRIYLMIWRVRRCFIAVALSLATGVLSVLLKSCDQVYSFTLDKLRRLCRSRRQWKPPCGLKLHRRLLGPQALQAPVAGVAPDHPGLTATGRSARSRHALSQSSLLRARAPGR